MEQGLDVMPVGNHSLSLTQELVAIKPVWTIGQRFLVCYTAESKDQQSVLLPFIYYFPS